jgi:hypothetical protein
VSVISAKWGVLVGGSPSRLVLGKIQDPISKVTKAKRAEDAAQVVEHPLSKKGPEFKPQYRARAHTHTHTHTKVNK